MYPASEKRFLAINAITIFTLFVLILAGGVVRSSGSGMGCPDWPKCFDQYIPPTSASQIPEGYQEKYVQKRIAKNERFAKTLDVMGYGELAARIRNDKSILLPEEFNVAKTWTEYVNRLVGAISGFLLLGCLLFSSVYLKTKKRIFFLSLINLIIVGFQAWLGSIVVSTNLLAWVVTIHMLLALVIIGISIYTYFQARILRDRSLLSSKGAGGVKAVSVAALLLTIVQIVLGTEVREQIDAVAEVMDNLNRSEWVSKVGIVFNLHRDLAMGVLLLNGILFLLIRGRYILSGMQFRYVLYAVVLIVLQLITGIILSYLALPAAAQAIHIVLATLIFGAQYYLVLLLKRSKLHRN